MRANIVRLIVVIAALPGLVFAYFSDDFENGIDKWEATTWMDSVTWSASEGNPGTGGEYYVWGNNGGVYVSGSAWEQAGMSEISDYSFAVDMKIKQAGADYILSRNLTGIWDWSNSQGLNIWGGPSDWKIRVLGASVPDFSAANIPAGINFDFSGWNRYEITGIGDYLVIKINGVTLWNGTANMGSSAFGTPGLRTGWTGNAVLDNVVAVPEPTTLTLLSLSGLCLICRKKK